MIGDFRRQVLPHYCFVEFTYPRTKTWTLQQYAQAVLDMLVENGITHGWIIAESFGSQVGWKLLELQRAHPEKFTPEGLILAGGFVHINLCITLFGKTSGSLKTIFTPPFLWTPHSKTLFERSSCPRGDYGVQRTTLAAG